MFEDFSGSMGVAGQVVSHLVEELGLEGLLGSRKEYGPVSTWSVPLEDAPCFEFARIRDLVASHGEMLAHEQPGVVLGIMMHTADKNEYYVTSISVFPKGVRESIYEWLDSRFGSLEVRKSGMDHGDDMDYNMVEIGDSENDYFWYNEERSRSGTLVVGDEVYNPLEDIAFGYGYFMYYGIKDGPFGRKQAVWWDRDRDTGAFVLDWFNSRYGKVLYPDGPKIAYIDFA